jgi:hypothetical protein
MNGRRSAPTSTHARHRHERSHRLRARSSGARAWDGCLLTAGVVALAGMALLAGPEVAWAAGNNVGHNLGGLLKQYAGEIYGGVVAIVGLVFLINRRYSELGLFLLAAVIVGWLVFSPDQVARAAREIGRQILG